MHGQGEDKKWQWMKHKIKISKSDINHDFLITQLQPRALDNWMSLIREQPKW